VGDLHRNFSRSEFKCKCGVCRCDTVDSKLLEILIDVRERFERSVKINSAHRCVSYNKRVGGTTKSQHLLGKAADIVVSGHSPRAIYMYLDSKYPDSLGLGDYEGFTHVDSRDGKARW
jgi:uncharacterized protein YcbK (DUF882 family)